MSKISDSDVQILRDEFKGLEKRLTNWFEQSEKESIWSIPSKCKVWFYSVLSVCGFAVSVFTLYKKRDKCWIEIFDALWNGIVGSVVVWFGFQVVDLVVG